MSMEVKTLSVVVVVALIFASVSVGAFSLRNKDFSGTNNFILKHITAFKIPNYASRSHNQDASVLICFKDHLYMGTLNPRDGCELWRTTDGSNWTVVVGGNGKIPNGFGKQSNSAIWVAKVFGEYLYLGTVNVLQGCEVWRSSDGLNWTAVVGGDSHVPNGFGRFSHRFNSYAWYTEVFNMSTKEYPVQVVPHLCIGTLNVLFGGQIWASSDGENWTRLIEGIGKKNTRNGFGDRDNYGIRTMELYDGRLYVGTATRFYITSKGCEIWSTNDGLSWTRVNEDGFGDSWNIYAWSMEEFNGSLYVGTINLREGCEIWRASDGISWTKVVDGGINDKNNLGARKMTVFQDHLYVSTWNLISGCEVWRTKDGLNWTQVNEDGFGNPRNIAIRAFTEFKDNLYAGTWNMINGYSLWRYDGNNWTKLDVENNS